uniref:DUF3106 domain-containing protein n=1 Tax=Desulfacinum infernum TaxID=35837 RepID=A0A832A167_9BACT
MRESVCRRLGKKFMKAAPVVLAFAGLLGTVAGKPDSAWAAPLAQEIQAVTAAHKADAPARAWPTLYAKRPESREDGYAPFPGSRDRRDVPPQYQEWQSMPPPERDALRRRLEEYRKLPPQEQELYRQRYRQWQQIPPEDRRRIESDIQRWNELSPDQREAIRRLFNR